MASTRQDGHLAAFDAWTGHKVWDFDTGIGIIAAPMTCSVGGRQYVATEPL